MNMSEMKSKLFNKHTSTELVPHYLQLDSFVQDKSCSLFVSKSYYDILSFQPKAGCTLKCKCNSSFSFQKIHICTCRLLWKHSIMFDNFYSVFLVALFNFQDNVLLLLNSAKTTKLNTIKFVDNKCEPI